MPIKPGFRFERKYICIGLDYRPCNIPVSRPGVRCGKCSHRYYLTTNRERDRERNAARQAAHYVANSAEYKARSRQWKLDNPARAAANARRDTERRRETVRASSSRWNKAHPEVIAAASSRRRTRVTVGMTKLDRELSAAYRLAIAGDTCFYCGAAGEEYDHYEALAAGGTDHWWNLVRACLPCNRRKQKLNGDQFLEAFRQ